MNKKKMRKTNKNVNNGAMSFNFFLSAGTKSDAFDLKKCFIRVYSIQD